MATTMTVKGQVTIPKRVREALYLTPGDRVEFDVDSNGRVLVLKAGAGSTASGECRDHFGAARGKAQVKWRTDDLMALLRSEDCVHNAVG